jgi:serine/threonine protein kinase
MEIIDVKLPTRYQPSAGKSQGGMGEIFECQDTHLDRKVVLKMLQSGQDVRRLLDEQKALMRLRSKHVVQLYDVVNVSTDRGTQQALAIEYIKGEDLTPGSFSADMAFLKTLWQIACGLSDVHSEGVIHRDIKPDNIRLDEEGVIKILDFGLSRPAGPEAKTLSIIGTLGFMAPELWTSADIGFDSGIDAYAFGVTALNLLSKTLPLALKTRPPTSINDNDVSSIMNGCPLDVIEVVQRCLRFKAADRPSMMDVESILKRHLLVGKHRALLVLGTETYEINTAAPGVNVKSGQLGAIELKYTGLDFEIVSQSGVVSVNNVSMKVGKTLPACCVITFGGSQGKRTFVTFDVSNPEVMP